MSRGLLFVISGPSAVGKDALIARLLERDERLRYSVSNTTRPRREYERDGIHYNFLTREEFERKVAAGALLEWAQYGDNLYGTSREFVDGILEQGLDVIAKPEVKGAAQIRSRRPEAILVFIAPPSLEELARRRKGRGDVESGATFEARQRIASEEMAQAESFDHVVVNENLDRAVEDVLKIIESERKQHAH